MNNPDQDISKHEENNSHRDHCNSGGQIMSKFLNPTVHDGVVTMDNMKIGTHEQKLHIANTIHVYPLADNQKTKNKVAVHNYDHMFKILLIGNSQVGKTSLLLRYTQDTFSSGFISTIGIDFKVKTIVWQNKTIKLQLWDTAGQERYQTITCVYYRGAHGIILMYDVTNSESFNQICSWYDHIKTNAPQDVEVVLVGNKLDLEKERVVSTNLGSNTAQKLKLEFFEISAKENINVNAMFESLVDIICDKTSKSQVAQTKIQVRLKDMPVAQNHGCVVNC